MGNPDGKTVPLPSNDNTWENWVSHVLLEKYGYQPNAYGRSGQKQHGIDFVIDKPSGRIGVQCKHVAQGSKLDVSQVEKDIEASFSIPNRLNQYLLYTSAQSDTATIDVLNKLKPALRERGVEFSFLMWREFEEEIRRYDLFDRLNGIAPSDQISVVAGKVTSKPKAGASVAAQSPTIHSAAVSLYGEMLSAVKEQIAANNSSGAAAILDAVLKHQEQLADSELAQAFSTKAILASRAGHMGDAAKLWRKAAQVEPDENLKHGRRAQAFICEDQYEAALNEALPALTLQPPSVLAALAALIAAQNVGRRAEIDGLLSDRLKAERDIALVRAHVALADGDLELAKSIAKEASEEFADDADLIGLNADLLFRTALGGHSRKRAEITSGAALQALRKAVTLYRQSLDLRDPVADRAGWQPAALNLVSVFKLLKEDGNAAEIAEAIIDRFGSTVDDFDRLVLALAEGGKAERALKLTECVERGTVRLRLARASALLHLKKFADAEKVLEEVSTVAAGQDADNAGWMLLAARVQMGPTADIAALADEYYERAESKLTACFRIVECATGFGHAQLRLRYSKMAIDLYAVAPDPEFEMFVIDSYLALNEIDEALKFLLPAIDIEHPQGGPMEERLAFCLLQRQRFGALEKLLTGVRKAATDLSRFDGYFIDFHLMRGDRFAALEMVREARSRRAGDLKLHALEAALLLESGDLSKAKETLRQTPFEEGASLSAVALYVQTARRLEDDEAANELAYRWIRENVDSPENAAWFISDFLLGRKARSVPVELPQVTRRCGVCLVAARGERRPHWMVIDDRFPADVAGGWVSPQSPHIVGILGKSANTTVDFPAFPGGPFVIRSIVPVFDGAFRLIQSRYGRDLPMAPSLKVFSVESAGDEPDLSAIFKVLDETKAATERALSVYGENPLPLAVVAEAIGRHPIELWDGLVGSENHVRAMSGEESSTRAFLQRLGQDAPDIVLDPLTLIGWRTFNLLPTMLKAIRSIRMPVASVVLIRQKREELELSGDGPSMVLAASERSGFYERTDITPEIATARKKRLDDILQWIDDHVDVVPVPAVGLPDEAYSALRTEWPAYIADSMQLAAHDRRILVADDLGVEYLSSVFHVSQVPTASVLRAAADAKRITISECAQGLRELVKANYEFISLKADDLWAVTDLEANSIPPDVSVMIRYLRIASLKVESGVSVLKQYLQILIQNYAPPWFVAGCLTLGLSALTRHATRETSQVFQALFEFCDDLPRGYRRATYLALISWLQGHFLSMEAVGFNP